ncbi:MAG: imidazole glycerol phosphate synthase subunit HisF [Legionellales bacterium]|nr:imidazole glycerol phosphate synthase subunit HisF [Legionellales bacterium]|tara:strand:- start:788 stop:1543 length:756 start_codon:yes stop_codon:yes gene_type:complete
MKFRIIPVLLFKNGSLVKSVGFDNHRIVGDVTSSIRVFSKRQADEMIIYDLDARKKGEFNSNLIKYSVQNCNMPLTMGGGINTLADASRLIDEGCDKISVSTLIHENKNVVLNIAKKYGSQAIVATIDYRTINKKHYVFSHNGKICHGETNIGKLIKLLTEIGVGEVILSSIDRDGSMTGYDKKVIDNYGNCSKLPLIISGGCQSSSDMFFSEKRGFSGAAAGSIFYWKGDSIMSLKSELRSMGSNVRAVV